MIVKPYVDDLPRVKGFNVSIPYIYDHVESIVGDLTNTTNKEAKATTNEIVDATTYYDGEHSL